jgi:O-methyltransferase
VNPLSSPFKKAVAPLRTAATRLLLRMNRLSPDITPAERRILRIVGPFTKTSAERLVALIRATHYVVDNEVPGSFAECGVWRGGSMMAVALALQDAGDTSRTLYLYDTFEGMTAPTLLDRDFAGQPASVRAPRTGPWLRVGLDEARDNLLSTGYPAEQLRFVAGKVEETIPATIPQSLALLRLDTDWYQSTHHELLHLYPLLQPKGILIIDDYGHWEGARRATDEYLKQAGACMYLHRIDYTGRIGVKLPPG